MPREVLVEVTTDGLIHAYAAILQVEAEARGGEPSLTLEELQRAIPPAIDAVYAARDNGGNMHSAGAAAAVAAVEALRR